MANRNFNNLTAYERGVALPGVHSGNNNWTQLEQALFYEVRENGGSYRDWPGEMQQAVVDARAAGAIHAGRLPNRKYTADGFRMRAARIDAQQTRMQPTFEPIPDLGNPYFRPNFNGW
ncbi:hypothetical protein EG329_004942 [Mollisiaceae sp. DMI_Dod_QoI]|nr:hypothetical protein EG329_004942 [Helotiales sp. DMI_Dod_QoI]